MNAFPSTEDKNPPIKIIVGFSPGGTSDVVARVLAEDLRVELKRNVIVENKPGAIGRIAAQSMLNSSADGSTYLFSPDSWAIFPTLMLTSESLKYNYHKDFKTVAKVISYPLGLYAGKSAGVSNFEELLEKARKDSKYTFYAATGTGGVTEFLGIVLSKKIGVKMITVPYKGAAGVKNALLGYEAMSGIMAPGDLSGLIKDGHLIPLGMMSKNRWSVMPDVPTMLEQGYDITQGEAFMGLWASAKTNDSEINKMEEAIKKIVSTEKFKNKMIQASVYPDFMGSKELAKEIEDLIAFWKPVVEDSGYSLNK